ncbi:putative lrr receptor-like serine/threonine-protein kinase [Quercus suber]|uniref:non-specific serine/threonine protein kinase n=1 Tax=Quercus suber TaxID=58331 RepID=A0AAW0IT94_QUESU
MVRFLGNNSLSGTLPNLKSEELLNVNLVANNFIFDKSNVSVMPGLNCLQRNFPCNRNSPLYAKFSIKCGGPEMPAEGIVYEAENSSSFGAAWYYVTNTEKWAVSNVGLFAERNDQIYVQHTLAQVIATNTPELYQTSRMSPGSLRYYGLGLDNGLYNVSLFFAETGFDDRSSQTWKSLGRRVFDIYIQGSLELKDFDISKEAGGVERAIRKIFRANVSENYLEIHLFWAGKGTCCIPVYGYYGPLISAIHVVSDFVSNVPGIPPSNRGKKSRLGLIVGIAVPVGVVSLFFIFAVFYMKRKLHYNEEGKNITAVVEGTLSDGRIVAVKQLSVASHQGKSQFVTEISTISAVQHRNLVKLYGCCIEGDKRLLVYEYLENGSLDQALFGYLAPEYAMRGHLTEKADVFSFGVVALEILSGRPNSDNSLDTEKIYLLEWAWTLHENNQSLKLVDPTLTEFDENEAARVIAVSLLCTQASPNMRPPMSRVVAMLAGDIKVGIVTSKPSYLTDWNFKDITSSFLSEEDIKHHEDNTNLSKLNDPLPSAVNVIETMFGGIIGDGR